MHPRSVWIGVVFGSLVTVGVYETRAHLARDAPHGATHEATHEATPDQDAPAWRPQLATQGGAERIASLTQENASLRLQNANLLAAAGRGQAGDGDAPANEHEASLIGDMDQEQWRESYSQTDVDRKVESTIQERVESHFAALSSNAKVECRSGCCRMSMTTDDPDKLYEMMTSSVGIGWFPSNTSANVVLGNAVQHTLCLGSNELPDLDAMPNRGIERDALVENALPSLSLCAKKASSAFALKMKLSIDEDGQISDIDSTEKYSGDASATCAGAALLTHAAFAPWIRPTTIVLEFRLDPKSGASLL